MYIHTHVVHMYIHIPRGEAADDAVRHLPGARFKYIYKIMTDNYEVMYLQRHITNS